MNILIVNIHDKETWLDVPTFKVDRSSPVGNPYLIYEHGTRERVIELYRRHFERFCNTRPGFQDYLWDIREAVRQHGTIQLACWCAPKACHAEVIREWLLAYSSPPENMKKDCTS